MTLERLSCSNQPSPVCRKFFVYLPEPARHQTCALGYVCSRVPESSRQMSHKNRIWAHLCQSVQKHDFCLAVDEALILPDKRSPRTGKIASREDLSEGIPFSLQQIAKSQSLWPKSRKQINRHLVNKKQNNTESIKDGSDRT